MKRKRNYKKLGSVAQEAVSLMRDKEVRKDLLQAQQNSMQVLKWTGISIAAIAATIIITRQVKKAIKRASSKKEVKEIAENIKKSNLTHDNSFYASLANKLYMAFDPESKTEFFQNYDEAQILEALKSLQNKDEWYQVVNEFGVRHNNPTNKDLNLLEFLREDGEMDRKEYNSILSKLGVSTLI